MFGSSANTLCICRRLPILVQTARHRGELPGQRQAGQHHPVPIHDFRREASASYDPSVPVDRIEAALVEARTPPAQAPGLEKETPLDVEEVPLTENE